MSAAGIRALRSLSFAFLRRRAAFVMPPKAWDKPTVNEKYKAERVRLARAASNASSTADEFEAQRSEAEKKSAEAKVKEAAEARAKLAERGIVPPEPPARHQLSEETRAKLAELGIVPTVNDAMEEGEDDGDLDVSDGTSTGAGAVPAASEPAGASEAVEAAATGSVAGIEDVLGYRTFKGNEQWRVRWVGYGEQGDSWESLSVLDTEDLRRKATLLKEGGER